MVVFGYMGYNLDMPTLNGSRSYRKKNWKIGLLRPPSFVVLFSSTNRYPSSQPSRCQLALVSMCFKLFQFPIWAKGLHSGCTALTVSNTSGTRIRNLGFTEFIDDFNTHEDGGSFGGAPQNHPELAIVYDVYGENNDLEVTQVRETDIFSHMNENRTVRMVGEMIRTYDKSAMCHIGQY